MAITSTTKVPTLDWWKPASKLQKGDYVFDSKGRIVQVTLVQEYPQEDCYEITFNDYTTICGDDQLTLGIEDKKYRDRLGAYKGKNKFQRPLRFLTPPEIQAVEFSPSVPTADPPQFPNQVLPVPPFVFGFWFFNRKKTKVFTAPKGKHDELVAILRDYGFKTKHSMVRPTGRNEFTISPTIESQLVPNIPTRIPNNYIYAAVEQRIELLRGILMTKTFSYNPKNKQFRFTSKNLALIRQVQAVIELLGSTTTLNTNARWKNYTLRFKTHIQLYPEQPPAKPIVHYGRRFIKKISKIPRQMCVHIETTGEDNSVLVGEGFIPCR